MNKLKNLLKLRRFWFIATATVVSLTTFIVSRTNPQAAAVVNQVVDILREPFIALVNYLAK